MRADMVSRTVAELASLGRRIEQAGVPGPTL
jgi:hypothetical protein